ncbi:hypothetical protein ABN028_00890 [Actinopolymorpha sp. B17G11]|uniref:hypothetical protein n=1 Tax=Actinopolymorpha sp. B17G11 TaxID=3160861 RepID=UPI0032E39076
MTIVTQVRDSVAAGVGATRRVTLGGLALRLLGWVAGAGALLLAMPGRAYSLAPALVVVVAVVVPLVTVVLPGRWPVLALELLAVGGWVAGTATSEARVAFLPVLALAAALYVHHSASGFAAAVPLNVRFLPGVVRRWLVRTGAVLGVTALIAAVAVPLDARVGDVSTVVVPALGVLLAILVAGLLAYAVRER